MHVRFTNISFIWQYRSDQKSQEDFRYHVVENIIMWETVNDTE